MTIAETIPDHPDWKRYRYGGLTTPVEQRVTGMASAEVPLIATITCRVCGQAGLRDDGDYATLRGDLLAAGWTKIRRTVGLCPGCATG